MMHNGSGETHPGLSLEQKRAKIIEIINPQSLPAAAFQSYEYFDSNASTIRDGFIDGEFRNPSLEYPNLHQEERLSQFTADLDDAIERVGQLEEDPEYRAATVSTLEFRKAEIAYVGLQAEIDRLVREGGEAELLGEKIGQAKTLGHELYGRPQPGVVQMALGEIWHQIDEKDLSDSAEAIRQELEHGFIWNDSAITGLPRPLNPGVRLPNLAEEESLKWAGELMLAENADIVSLVHEYWEQHIQKPAEEAGEKPSCTTEQMVELFEHVIRLRDPEGKYGIGVISDPKASALSWDSPTMAVKVGMKRAAIGDVQTMLGLVMHEFGVHGQRAMNGLKTELPVLGMGLFTDTDPADYLTYEEGLATMLQEAIKGEMPRWEPANLGHYVHIALVEQGNDFRSVFEKAWRYRLLMQIGPGEELTDDMILKQKRSTYTSLVRIFRGTPADLAEKRPDVASWPYAYPKDLAYLAGRIHALIDLRRLYEDRDEAGFERRFAGKYDPLNPMQAAVAEKAVGAASSA